MRFEIIPIFFSFWQMALRGERGAQSLQMQIKRLLDA